MAELRTITAEVTSILESRPRARDSDELLYSIYLAKHGVTMPSVQSFFSNFEEYRKKGIASFESVSRARRKIQETREDLQATKETKDARDQLSIEFYDYAKGY